MRGLLGLQTGGRGRNVALVGACPAAVVDMQLLLRVWRHAEGGTIAWLRLLQQQAAMLTLCLLQHVGCFGGLQ